MTLAQIAIRQREWSSMMFGDDPRLEATLTHIEEELEEIRNAPTDPEEYADVILLVLDLAWRQGIQAHEIENAVVSKQLANRSRTWHVGGDSEPIRHVKETQ